MGYNRQEINMKKIAMVLIAMVGIAFVANAQQDKKSIQGDYNNTVLVSVSDDSQSSTSITFYNNSTKTIEVCVKIYNDSGVEIGQGCYTVPAAPAQGSHSETTKTVSKISPCRGGADGCEVKGIKITSAKVRN